MNIQNWTFYYPGFEPLSCTAPCTMLSVLYEHGKIPDPHYGLNERELQYLADKDCAFEAKFTVDAADLKKDHQYLIFHGLDTICHIYLNGELLERVQNMHRTYEVCCRQALREGENTLRLEFKSPTRYFAREQHRHYLYMNDGDTIPGAAHLRKAMYQSGWDWGPTLPDMGIWRPVELKCYDVDRLYRTTFTQDHHDGVVDVTVKAESFHDWADEIFVTLDGQRKKVVDGEVTITVENPRLWWVRGFGEQPLYDVLIELEHEGVVIDTMKKRIGLRTLTVSTEKDADKKGSEFCFVINGVKIFSMGANYIPMDNLLSCVTDERIEDHIQWAIDANFNTLRIWGGGYYPEDKFYDLCDEKGIMVWEDFMVACANIWFTEEMKEEFTVEAIDNLNRLNHHPSLAILCGNNEMEDMIINAGAQNTEHVRHDYIHLCEILLPEICREYAPDTFYWPSSPSSGGGFDDPGNHARGDTHYWTVWHGGVPFTTYRQMHFRFCSEYGFEAFPSMKTIRTFCEEKDHNCFSRVMENHQKCKGGNGKILRYLSDNYLYPAKFEDLVYASQLLQADAIKYGVEHFRRERGWCMGSIYWQFNDCWPVASWSSVDSCGRYKALHYAARKFYAPVAMGLFLEKGKLTVNVSNETMKDFSGSLRLRLCSKDFTVIDEKTAPVSVEALESLDVYRYRVPACDAYTTYFYVDLLDETGALVQRQVEMQAPCKHFEWDKPTVTAEFTDVPGGVQIAVSGDTFTKGVMLDFEGFDCVLTDNFFSITDAEPYIVTARTDRSAAELKAALTVKTVYDIR
ncbi:MAG: glycoside hydrolase family 2 protein [Oscillospiraceae bacterium]|nr:glycoside hydrolase family 2 protein [Oscillospiraceae bacterium]